MAAWLTQALVTMSFPAYCSYSQRDLARYRSKAFSLAWNKKSDVKELLKGHKELIVGEHTAITMDGAITVIGAITMPRSWSLRRTGTITTIDLLLS